MKIKKILLSFVVMFMINGGFVKATICHKEDKLICAGNSEEIIITDSNGCFVDSYCTGGACGTQKNSCSKEYSVVEKEDDIDFYKWDCKPNDQQRWYIVGNDHCMLKKPENVIIEIPYFNEKNNISWKNKKVSGDKNKKGTTTLKALFRENGVGGEWNGISFAHLKLNYGSDSKHINIANIYFSYPLFSMKDRLNNFFETKQFKLIKAVILKYYPYVDTFKIYLDEKLVNQFNNKNKKSKKITPVINLDLQKIIPIVTLILKTDNEELKSLLLAILIQIIKG